ncbi:MAG: FkbM family methyltransferase [Alphaproteobacteria bacterium]|nr:FkbM family methyltransferase [Alphaproteobacteria bacterium]
MLEYKNTDLWSAYGHTFYAPALNKDSIALDLGASTALFGHEVADEIGCQFHAVEALPENFERIKETDLLKKHHFAICGEDKSQNFSVVDDEDRWGLIRSGGVADQGETVEVPGITLKSFLGHIGADLIDLAKIDIESAEIAMFDSTDDETLRSIKQISIEFHDFMDPNLIEPVQRILQRMDVLGFHTFVFTRNFHGDVLFINPEHIELSGVQVFTFKHITKNLRGIQRILSRGSLK